MSNTGIIYGVNGPVIYLKGDSGFKISEMVYVGPENLVGEIIGLKKGMTTVQVFEETTGLKPGDTVTGTGDAISVLLGPGIIHNIFDGIQRPLEEIAKASGKYISRGVSVDSLDTQKKWNTHITVKEGDVVGPGSIIAETQETDSILHKSMVPPNLTEATVIHAAADGEYTILEPIVTIQFADGTTRDLALAQKWPIRIPRPTHQRFPASVPLVTGQRILDTLFPIAKGGTAAVPGGFGTGKTMTQHQIAKWADADIIIYAGSLVNPELLEYAKDSAEIYNSAKMNLDEVIDVMKQGDTKNIVRLHTGDPCVYGAIREQMDRLDKLGIEYDVCPGVSSFCGAAAALKAEYTLPDVSQTVIITRMEGRTPVPPKEKIHLLASHNATMVIFLSTGLLKELSAELVKGGYSENTPAAIVYKATWKDEKVMRCTVGTLNKTAEKNGIKKTALITVGDFLGDDYSLSKLYDKTFTTEFRKGVTE